MTDRDQMLVELHEDIERFCEALRAMVPESLHDALKNSAVWGDVLSIRMALVEWHEGAPIQLGLFATTEAPEGASAHGDH